MSATPDHQALAASTGEEKAHIEAVTTSIREFDPDAPLPDLNIRQARSWEPAARRFRDLTDEEKREQA